MIGNVTLEEFLSAGQVVPEHRPVPRVRLDTQSWHAMIEQMPSAEWTIMALWGEPDEVHVALRDEDTGHIAVASHPCPEHRFQSLSRVRPSAARLERAVHDLWGLAPMGAEDRRPWLDHGRWSRRHPLAARSLPAAEAPYIYDFLTAEGDGLHQIPVGPVHAGVIEPGHFRFHAQGEAVVRLEERLGYVHKGIPGLLSGVPMERAARIVGRISGDATVAYALAFARAVEAATGCEIPRRAHWLRALMAEMERVANHIFDIGAVCNDAAFAIMLSHMGVLRERVLRANETLFGHRLLMDCIIPGGIAQDLRPEGLHLLPALMRTLRKDFNRAVNLYRETPSLLDRTTGTGILTSSLAHRFGAGGVVGRASGRAQDCRRSPGYPPYDELDMAVIQEVDGDVNARIEVRIAEVRASLLLISQLLADLPTGPVKVALPQMAGEGMATVESFRGEVLVWVRLDGDGVVERCHAHDPSWFQWPLLEAAIEGNIVADFPLCNKSFNCSYSGHDL